jgi:PAS domain S-box-containing protein
MLHQLRRSEQRWRFALEGDGGAPWDWDLTNDTVYRSPRVLSMLGIPGASHECPTSEAMTPFSPDDRDAIKASFRRLLKGLSDEVHGECNVHDQDGVPTCLSYSARVLARSPAGRAERVIGTLHDITRRKQREEEVRLQRESLAHHGRLLLLGEMAAITAHEINQPLTAIANYASVLSSALSDAPSLQELAERIEQQALRAGDVAWRTLALARRSQHEHRPIDIPALIDGTVRWFANGEYRSVRFSTQLPESLPQPTGDPIQIEQVLTNLVRNGIQAMDHLPNSAIEIDASHNAQQITIRVSDRGRGVPTKVAMDIYQPFFTTRERGIGLGLTICNSIISAHGGRLWCTPRPGGGTTFSFSLPCPAAPQPGPDHGATDPAANPPTATRPRP